MSGLVTVGTSGGLLADIGVGIDEFSVRVGAVGGQLSALFADSNTWVAAVAMAATAVSVVSAFRQVSEWIHGPSDARALAEHAAQRATDALGVRPTRVSWGVVYDDETGQPLPLARVSILDARGTPVARTVADVHGVYGFHLAAEQLYERGGIGGLHAQKDGYHHGSAVQPIVVGAVRHRTDVPMRRFGWMPAPAVHSPHVMARVLPAAAFWTGVGTVPMAYLAQPGMAGQVMIALFAFSAIVRAVGSRRAPERARDASS